MTGLILLADSEPNGNINGSWGLLVFVLLAIVLVFLFRSMNKHLRKAQRMKDDETPADDAQRRESAPPRKPKS